LKYKHKIIFIVSFLNILILISIVNVDVKAQEGYNLAVNTNEEFSWEVTELDLYQFETVLGFEPNFALGDRIRLIIRDIEEGSTGWSITVEFWDYKMDWGQSGSIETLPMHKYPLHYRDFIFILTPVDDYLAEVDEHMGPEYSVTANSISKVVRADTGRDYIMEKTYDRRGIPVSEALYEYSTGRMLVCIEGSLSIIPFGFYFIGFIIVALTAVIFITLRKKRIIFKNLKQ